jgi:hypothetical protein
MHMTTPRAHVHAHDHWQDENPTLEYLKIQDPIDFSREEYGMLYEVQNDAEDKDKAGVASLQEPQTLLQQLGQQTLARMGTNFENNAQGSMPGGGVGADSASADRKSSVELSRRLSMTHQVREIVFFV